MKKRRMATITVELFYHDGGGLMPGVDEIAMAVGKMIEKGKLNNGFGGAIGYGDYVVTGVTINTPDERY